MMKRRQNEPDIAEVASAIGDPARAAMLLALLDGRPLAASDLAGRAGVSPQAATAHFKKLVDANLIVRESVGRYRVFTLASPDVADALEALTAIAKPSAVVALPQAQEMERLRVARSCYDHLAGRLGVALAQSLASSKIIRLEKNGFDVVPSSERFFSALSIDLDALRELRRPLTRSCLDWTERKPHLAGSLGAALLDVFLEREWVQRHRSDRSLKITERGAREIHATFGIAL